MKVVLEKIDIIVRLKEKIAEAREENKSSAEQLQILLDRIMRDDRATSAI